MSEPRRSTRARAREEAAPAPEEKETPSKPARSLKRKRTTIAKDAAPATPLADGSQQQSRLVLPIRVAEGQPLPTLSEPQPLDLPSQDYQDIQQIGVLSASLERSRAVWISGSNFRLFHAFFAPPKKVAERSEADKQAVQRQKELVKNIPQIGTQWASERTSAIPVDAQLVIEPHTFPIRLYGPRETYRQPVKSKAPQYGQWPNHNHSQYPPYQAQQHHNSPAPYSKPPTPQPRPPPPPKPQSLPQPPPPLNTAAAPDPVIHMLAQRAGTDPELKDVMKIVAAGKANQEQLAFFQGHIAELTSILERQREAAAKGPQPALPPPPPLAATHPQPQPPPVPVQQAPQPPLQQHVQSPNATPGPQQYAAPTPPPRPPHPNQYTYNQPQQRQTQFVPAPQPPKTGYRPLVFDFVEGNGDKFYFPSYSFMEWLPSQQGVKFSFLITKMKPKPKTEPKESVPSTPAPKATPAPSTTVTPGSIPPASMPGNPYANPNTPNHTPLQMAPPNLAPTPTPTQYVAPPRIEDFDDKDDVKDVDFYQPVTVIVLSTNPEILQTLPRAVRPLDMVEKYMNEVFDRCKRADETYLAFRLPKEGVDTDGEVGVRESIDLTPSVPTPVDVVMRGTDAGTEKKKGVGRPRKSLVT